MRSATKYLPVLLLGSVLGGCSMAGTGDYMADEYAQIQQAHYAPQSPCAPSQCGSTNGHPVAQNPYVQQTVTPDSHAYGQSVQGHPAYGAPAYLGPRGKAKAGLRRGYTYGNLGAVAYDVDSELFGGVARLGYQSKSFFGAEVEGTLGFSDDEATILTGAGPIVGTVGVRNSIAAYGVARAPVSKRFNVLGRVGYHNTEFNGDIDLGGTVTEADFSTDGIAYGLGAEYAVSPKTSIRADYTIYDYDGPDADSLSLAIARKF